jgi:hypothetical protein
MYKMLLESNDKSSPLSGCYIEDPAMEEIKKRANLVFKYGGLVRLMIGVKDVNNNLFTFYASLAMDSLPGLYRLIYSPKNKTSLEKSNLYEWWEAGDSPFRGMIAFGDDDWDARTVSADLDIANIIFKDMHENGYLTEISMSQMRSVWDRKPQG